ncbi:MAG: DUF4129 domain-containing protein [Gorillibacterium sp.]|nr:DUF4129 domain-containing protein [Gorillibacterium sp.]
MDIQEDKEKLRQILERSEYDPHSKSDNLNPIKTWLEKLWNRLIDLFPDSAIPQGASKLLAIITLFILVAVLAYFIIRLTRGIVMSRRMTGQSHRVFHGSDLFELSHTQLLQEAQSFADHGDYREAVRRMFLASLLLMNCREWVTAEKWKTNHEYVEELQERYPVLVPAFIQSAELFERVYYGGENADVLDYERISVLLAPLWPEGGRG